LSDINKRTRITASTAGVLLGMAGIFNHGIFEILQGSSSTNGFFIEAIGEANRFWTHGTEAAFTVIHNFLITGIFAVFLGLAVIYWSLKYIHVKHGATVFLFLLILLTLVGGGIGYILLFVPTWAFATRINKPLDWWGKKLSPGLRQGLSALWIYFLVVTTVAWLTLMELGIFGYFPGQNHPDTILNIVFGFLFASSILACITFICAFAGDFEKQQTG
jgi:hypothetical protein